MQKSTIIQNLKKEIEELKQIFAVFEQQNHLTPEEAGRFIQHAETLYRNLAVYTHIVNHDSISSELDVHLKIMKAVEKKEGAKIEIAPPKEEVKKEAPYVKQEIPGLFSDTDKNTAKDEPRVKDENKVPVVNNTNTKKIEIGINDKYRILNELFDQQQIEFNVVIEQLNVTENWEEAEIYLGSLLEIYGWKVDNELVKTLYSLVQKRFI